uniref:C2 domain-containing protein n=1 Tax=Myripristis murdjan TaxID=586833 RepID=A0A668AUQ3_9TELE
MDLILELLPLDLLYEEAVYTVVNRVGVATPEYVKSEEDIFTFLLKVHLVSAFGLRFSLCFPQLTLITFAIISGHKFSHLSGYSDPYCMLGILLGQSPRESEEKKERKFSFRKRKEKCIHVTEVKPETLNPVWDEHFQHWPRVCSFVLYAPSGLLFTVIHTNAFLEKRIRAPPGLHS